MCLNCNFDPRNHASANSSSPPVRPSSGVFDSRPLPQAPRPSSQQTPPVSAQRPLPNPQTQRPVPGIMGGVKKGGAQHNRIGAATTTFDLQNVLL